jgi:hypothetical protein
MAKQKTKQKKSTATKKGNVQSIFVLFRSDHELVGQHVQKNHIYLLFVHHIVHNEMDYRENNEIVYVYNTLQNL